MKFILLPFFLFSIFSFGQNISSWDDEKIEVKNEESQNTILSAKSIISEGWAELAQPIFWQRIMTLSSDSCIVNIAKTRTILSVMSNADWNRQTKIQKGVYRDSIREVFQLNSEDHIYVTTGKSDFYKFDVVYPSLSEGIEAFESNGVDPWYAQAILLIESPGQLKKSRAGAYGPFQLMPAVARAQGLTVNRYKDERSNFERSAFGASQLIRKICIPEAKRILDAKQIAYNENDIWFRLFVLHVYHAGAGNVAAVVNKINPTEGNQELITQMWQTKAAQFGNNSQNYSQLALASQLILNDIVHKNCIYILDCASVK